MIYYYDFRRKKNIKSEEDFLGKKRTKNTIWLFTDEMNIPHCMWLQWKFNDWNDFFSNVKWRVKDSICFKYSVSINLLIRMCMNFLFSFNFFLQQKFIKELIWNIFCFKRKFFFFLIFLANMFSSTSTNKHKLFIIYKCALW